MYQDLNSILIKQPILLYDGECVFCNKSLHFFLEHEKQMNLSLHGSAGLLHFAPLQSEVGIALKSYFELDEKIDSLILIRDHSAFIKSCAALRLTRYMKGFWPLMQIFLIIPPFIRNFVYDFIAKRRKKIFGRSSSCRLFTEEENARLLHF